MTNIVDRLCCVLERASPAVEMVLEQAAPRQKDHWHKILVEISEALTAAATTPSSARGESGQAGGAEERSLRADNRLSLNPQLVLQRIVRKAIRSAKRG